MGLCEGVVVQKDQGLSVKDYNEDKLESGPEKIAWRKQVNGNPYPPIIQICADCFSNLLESVSICAIGGRVLALHFTA